MKNKRKEVKHQDSWLSDKDMEARRNGCSLAPDIKLQAYSEKLKKEKQHD